MICVSKSKPFGTIDLRGGKGSKFCQICIRRVVKNCPRRGVEVKNCENLPTSQMDGTSLWRPDVTVLIRASFTMLLAAGIPNGCGFDFSLIEFTRQN